MLDIKKNIVVKSKQYDDKLMEIINLEQDLADLENDFSRVSSITAIYPRIITVKDLLQRRNEIIVNFQTEKYKTQDAKRDAKYELADIESCIKSGKIREDILSAQHRVIREKKNLDKIQKKITKLVPAQESYMKYIKTKSYKEKIDAQLTILNKAEKRKNESENEKSKIQKLQNLTFGDENLKTQFEDLMLKISLEQAFNPNTFSLSNYSSELKSYIDNINIALSKSGTNERLLTINDFNNLFKDTDFRKYFLITPDAKKFNTTGIINDAFLKREKDEQSISKSITQKNTELKQIQELGNILNSNAGVKIAFDKLIIKMNSKPTGTPVKSFDNDFQMLVDELDRYASIKGLPSSNYSINSLEKMLGGINLSKYMVSKRDVNSKDMMMDIFENNRSTLNSLISKGKETESQNKVLSNLKNILANSDSTKIKFDNLMIRMAEEQTKNPKTFSMTKFDYDIGKVVEEANNYSKTIGINEQLTISDIQKIFSGMNLSKYKVNVKDDIEFDTVQMFNDTIDRKQESIDKEEKNIKNAKEEIEAYNMALDKLNPERQQKNAHDAITKHENISYYDGNGNKAELKALPIETTRTGKLRGLIRRFKYRNVGDEFLMPITNDEGRKKYESIFPQSKKIYIDNRSKFQDELRNYKESVKDKNRQKEIQKSMDESNIDIDR